MAHDEVRSQEWIDRIEELVRHAESLPDHAARSVAVELLEAVLAFHAAGLERMLEIAAASGAQGQAIIQSIAADDLAGSVLLLHDLHPDDLETRVARAIEKLRSHLGPQGADLSLIGIQNGIVHVRFNAGRGLPHAGLRAMIEAAVLQAAPEIAKVVVEGIGQSAAPPDFVPLANLFAGSRA